MWTSNKLCKLKRIDSFKYIYLSPTSIENFHLKQIKSVSDHLLETINLIYLPVVT